MYIDIYNNLKRVVISYIVNNLLGLFNIFKSGDVLAWPKSDA